MKTKAPTIINIDPASLTISCICKSASISQDLTKRKQKCSSKIYHSKTLFKVSISRKGKENLALGMALLFCFHICFISFTSYYFSLKCEKAFLPLFTVFPFICSALKQVKRWGWKKLLRQNFQKNGLVPFLDLWQSFVAFPLFKRLTNKGTFETHRNKKKSTWFLNPYRNNNVFNKQSTSYHYA